jgi:hypothetical protein
VIEVGDRPLLIWVRHIGGVDAEYDTFDAMLTSLHFRFDHRQRRSAREQRRRRATSTRTRRVRPPSRLRVDELVEIIERVT